MVTAVKSVLASQYLLEYFVSKSENFYKKKGRKNLVSRWRTIITNSGKYIIICYLFVTIRNFYVGEENDITFWYF